LKKRKFEAIDTLMPALIVGSALIAAGETFFSFFEGPKPYYSGWRRRF
jgi:hypothetical protein